MSEAQANTTAQTDSNTTPAAPTIDTAAITKEVTQAATTAAQKAAEETAKAQSKKFEQALKVLSGAKDEPEVDPLLAKLVQNPKEVLLNLKDMAVTESRKIATDEEAKKAKVNKIAAPFMAEYPELNEHLDYVDAHIAHALQRGESYEKAVETGFKTATEKLKLTKVSEEEKRQRAAYAAVPPMGGGVVRGTSQPAFDNKKSESDFIAGMRAKAQSFRTRKAE